MSSASKNESTRGGRILVVDDDPSIRLVVRDRFRALGHEVEVAEDGNRALTAIEAFDPAVVLLDLRMPNLDGFGVLEGLKALDASPQVVVITAHGSIEAAVRAIQMGAVDFIPKPFDNAHLEHVVSRCLETHALRGRLASLQTELSSMHSLVTGESPAMADAVGMAGRAAPSDATVLLLGESGSGKEVLARYIHQQSARADGPFVAVNCATLSEELLQSELFGHEKGAFTGALRSKMGRIEQAAGGTLFLDEIAEFAPAIQAKLLRVLQEREFERLGGTRVLKADVRIIAATHRDLTQAISDGSFRQDLYYRLNVVGIRVPPLRDRQGDLPALLEHFLQRHGKSAGRPNLRFAPEAMALLTRYGWPGNVREVSNVVERAVVLSQAETILPEDLPEELRDASGDEPACEQIAADPPAPGELLPYHDAVRAAKCRILREALERTEGHQTRAAHLLGLSQPYMARLMKNLGLRKPAS
jgi:DNA-binding NtrC family response regulator